MSKLDQDPFVEDKFKGVKKKKMKHVGRIKTFAKRKTLRYWRDDVCQNILLQCFTVLSNRI